MGTQGSRKRRIYKLNHASQVPLSLTFDLSIITFDRSSHNLKVVLMSGIKSKSDEYKQMWITAWESTVTVLKQRLHQFSQIIAWSQILVLTVCSNRVSKEDLHTDLIWNIEKWSSVYQTESSIECKFLYTWEEVTVVACWSGCETRNQVSSVCKATENESLNSLPSVWFEMKELKVDLPKTATLVIPLQSDFFTNE